MLERWLNPAFPPSNPVKFHFFPSLEKTWGAFTPHLKTVEQAWLTCPTSQVPEHRGSNRRSLLERPRYPAGPSALRAVTPDCSNILDANTRQIQPTNETTPFFWPDGAPFRKPFSPPVTFASSKSIDDLPHHQLQLLHDSLRHQQLSRRCRCRQQGTQPTAWQDIPPESSRRLDG